MVIFFFVSFRLRFFLLFLLFRRLVLIVISLSVFVWSAAGRRAHIWKTRVEGGGRGEKVWDGERVENALAAA